MQQRAFVKQILPDGIALVQVVRASACGNDCAKCAGGCSFEKQVVEAKARNPIGASPGDTVLVEGENRRLFSFAAAAYLVPLLLLFAGYGVGAAVFQNSALGAVCGGAFFAAGVAFACRLSRRVGARQEIFLEIVKKN